MITPSKALLPLESDTVLDPLSPVSAFSGSAKRLATKEEVCQEFGISPNTLTEWMKDGIVPFLRYGRRVYFEWPSLLAAGRQHTPPVQVQ